MRAVLKAYYIVLFRYREHSPKSKLIRWNSPPPTQRLYILIGGKSEIKVQRDLCCKAEVLNDTMMSMQNIFLNQKGNLIAINKCIYTN